MSALVFMRPSKAPRARPLGPAPTITTVDSSIAVYCRQRVSGEHKTVNRTGRRLSELNDAQVTQTWPRGLVQFLLRWRL